jgi:hypothetical protein
VLHVEIEGLGPAAGGLEWWAGMGRWRCRRMASTGSVRRRGCACRRRSRASGRRGAPALREILAGSPRCFRARGPPPSRSFTPSSGADKGAARVGKATKTLARAARWTNHWGHAPVRPTCPTQHTRIHRKCPAPPGANRRDSRVLAVGLGSGRVGHSARGGNGRGDEAQGG